MAKWLTTNRRHVSTHLAPRDDLHLAERDEYLFKSAFLANAATVLVTEARVLGERGYGAGRTRLWFMSIDEQKLIGAQDEQAVAIHGVEAFGSVIWGEQLRPEVNFGRRRRAAEGQGV